MIYVQSYENILTLLVNLVHESFRVFKFVFVYNFHGIDKKRWLPLHQKTLTKTR